MNSSTLIIGTRASRLAMWQANWALKLLSDNGVQSTLKTIESKGDQDQSSPLHLIGGNGLFTKTLDDALLNGQVDVAVHSLKDYPTQSHSDILMCAHLKREDPRDVLILNPNKPNVRMEKDVKKLGTGSVRRTAQWLHRHPKTEIVALRGNVPTRLLKLENNDWDGIILAYAGILRLGIPIKKAIPLNWMIPAPGQGVVGVTAKRGNTEVISLLNEIDDLHAHHCAKAERMFMAGIESGCSVPIGAWAKIEGQQLTMQTSITHPKGDISVQMHFNSTLDQYPAQLKNWIAHIKKNVIRDSWWK